MQPKRTEAVTVRLSPQDLDLFKRAADSLWPGAVITQSGILLGLARIAAEGVLKKSR
jgi:hypothetical protein